MLCDDVDLSKGYPTIIIPVNNSEPWSLSHRDETIMSSISIIMGSGSIISCFLLIYSIHKRHKYDAKEVGLIGLCATAILYSLINSISSLIGMVQNDYSCDVGPYFNTFAMFTQFLCHLRIVLTHHSLLTEQSKLNPKHIAYQNIAFWGASMALTLIFLLVEPKLGRPVTELMYNSTYCAFSYDYIIPTLVIPVTFGITVAYTIWLYVEIYGHIKHNFMDMQSLLSGDTSYKKLLKIFIIKATSYIIIPIISWFPYIVAVYYQGFTSINEQKLPYIISTGTSYCNETTGIYVWNTHIYQYERHYYTEGIPKALALFVIITTNSAGILISLIYGYNIVEYRKYVFCGLCGTEVTKISITPSGSQKDSDSGSRIKEYKMAIEKHVMRGKFDRKISFNPNEIRGDIDENGNYILIGLNGSNLIDDDYILKYARIYAIKQQCLEKVNFLLEVREYKKMYNYPGGWETANTLYEKYIQKNEVNVDGKLIDRIDHFFNKKRPVKGNEFDLVIKEINGMLRDVAVAITKSADAPEIAKYYLEKEEKENRTIKQNLRDEIQTGL